MLSYISNLILKNPKSPPTNQKIKTRSPQNPPNDNYNNLNEDTEHQSSLLHSALTLENYADHNNENPSANIPTNTPANTPETTNTPEPELEKAPEEYKSGSLYSNKEECRTMDLMLIIDKSGSMERHKNEMIEAINALVEEQKKDEATEYLISIVTFNHSYHLTLARTPAHKVKPLTKKDYSTSGRTALYDAIDYGIEYLSRIGSKETTVVIITDGLENCSKKFRNEQIKNRINEKKEQGWKFIYLAADPTLLKQGEDINIGNGTNSSNCSVDFSNLVSYARYQLKRMICGN